LKIRSTYRLSFFVLSVILLITFLINISLGSVTIPITEVFKGLFGGELQKESWEYILLDYRLPKAITAIITGSGLAVSGLLMQTLFKNPLAGPFVLGISSGASLGVALLILGGSFLGITQGLFLGKWELVLAACLGSFFVLITVLIVSHRVRDTMTLLIIGLMVGSLTAAFVSVLAYFSKAEELQRYIFWSFGSLGDQSWTAVQILTVCFGIGITITIGTTKSLNALLLGDYYAQSLGLQLKQKRMLIILATSILAGGITAFTGPIAFIGLAVPHLVRQFIWTSDHKVLLPAIILSGAIIMLLCDLVAQVPSSELSLPINAITALLGAPVVIWLLIRKKKLVF